MSQIANFRIEVRAPGARKWETLSTQTSHWPSAEAMWIEESYRDLHRECRMVCEWVRPSAPPSPP